MTQLQSKPRKHIIIPDLQDSPGVPKEHLGWIGSYVVDQKPDVLVQIGDWGDFNSLSTYDRKTMKAEGKRLKDDLVSLQESVDTLMAPIIKAKKKRPEMHVVLGNHEHRVDRYVNENPELAGVLPTPTGIYSGAGFTVSPFLVPRVIDGMCYVHYMANPLSGKPYGGSALSILKQVGHSFVMGHRQILDVATRTLPVDGRQQWGIVAGAAYPHEEEYLGPQGNKHWRGIIVLHEVEDGNCCPMFVSLNYLERVYG